MVGYFLGIGLTDRDIGCSNTLVPRVRRRWAAVLEGRFFPLLMERFSSPFREAVSFPLFGCLRLVEIVGGHVLTKLKNLAGGPARN
jgi:hypothetical protein